MSDEFTVGGKTYTQADILAMPIQDFTALRRQYDEEQRDGPDPKTLSHEDGSCQHCDGSGCVACDARVVAAQDARIRREPVVPVIEPETLHEVTFMFTSTVLGNRTSLERNVEKSRLEVKRILDRSLHADVDVTTHREEVQLTNEEINRMEGDAFEGTGMRRGPARSPMPTHRHDVV